MGGSEEGFVEPVVAGQTLPLFFYYFSEWFLDFQEQIIFPKDMVQDLPYENQMNSARETILLVLRSISSSSHSVGTGE